MNGNWPSRRYTIGTVLNWLMFLGVVFLLSWGDATGKIPYLLQAVLVALLVLSVAVQFAVAYRSIAVQDEFVRGVAFNCAIAAAGVTVTLAVAWGLIEQFLGAPHLPMWLVYPLFWAMFGTVSGVIKTSRT